MNFADFNAVHMGISEQFTNANWMGKKLPTQIKISRFLNKSLVFGAEFSSITLEPEKLNKIPVKTVVFSDKFTRFGGQLEYKFANGRILKEDSHFDPYLFLGVYSSIIDEDAYFTQSSGIGFNIWITDWLGVNAQGSYDYVMAWDDYLHYSFGLVAKIRSDRDSDKDGVTDDFDLCPKIPGNKGLNGCPDGDGDGIPDHLDKCPDIEGAKELSGCPDSDGDGIPDHLDECAEVFGVKKLKGCPEIHQASRSDSSTINPVFADKKNADDINSNNNKSDELERLVPSDFKSKTIFFQVSSSQIQSETIEQLDEIVSMMKKSPVSQFAINGYTDNSGSEAFNYQLSVDRANAVGTYLLEKGIDKKKLIIKGLGVLNSIGDNKTTEGRKKNRRVEIEINKPFHLIAGSFKKEKNALKLVKELSNIGYDSQIIGKDSNGFYRVSMASFVSKDEAQQELNKARLNFNTGIWLFEN
jgi:outer membrane protein OmpA-like peptidoglycan-associated protein